MLHLDVAAQAVHFHKAEGTVVDLVADDEGDDLREEERRALHDALTASSKSAAAGQLRSVSAILDEFRRR